MAGQGKEWTTTAAAAMVLSLNSPISIAHPPIQADYCAARGIGCKRLPPPPLPASADPTATGGGGGCALFPYHLSVPYAGAMLELVVTLPVPVQGGEDLWDEEEGEETEEVR